MLSMNAINNLDYYSKLAAEDYYTSGGEPPGIWAGLGARALHLTGHVDTKDYRKIFSGYAPDGTALCERPGDKHRAGLDLTFSAPKSVSLAWALSDEKERQQFQAGQLKAVQQALGFLEKHAAITRRGHGGHQQESVVGLVVALFEHSTSRAQDPLLHTHSLVANIAPRHDGSWGTLESRHLFLWQKAAGAIYRATLANHLREMGFHIEQPDGKDHFEIKGVSQRICRHFSKRAEAIEAALETFNVGSSASKIGNVVKLSTRALKQKIDRPALFNQWRSMLNTLGFTTEHLQSIRDKDVEVIPTPLPLSSIVEQVVEKQAVFRLQDLYAAVAIEAQWQHSDLCDIEHTVAQLIEQQDVISLGVDTAKNQLFSTPAMIALERTLIQHADKLQQQVHYQLPEHTIQQAINQQAANQGFALSDEQIEGVFSMCQSSLDILQGAAGAGKSTSTQAVKIAYESAGFTIRGATIAKQAAKQLEEETGIASGTLAKLLIELESGKAKLEKTIVVVDEAGQLSSPDLMQLMQAVHEAGGKLVLVGEQQQLSAITHSGSLRYLSQRQGCARIETIRRQRQSWAREAVMQFRTGDAMPALHAHNERGLLHFGDNSHQAREQLVQQWQQYCQVNPDKQTMILAQRWRDVKPLNALVRQVHQAQGKLGDKNIALDCVVGNNIMNFEFSRGERIRFTRNDYRQALTNGQLGTIESIEQQGEDIQFTVRCDDGRTVIFNHSDYCDDDGHLYLAQAYATTVYSSQGSTVDGDTFVYYSSSMDRSAAYVAGSRHKDNCHWFINNEEMDTLGGLSDKGIAGTEQTRLATLARCMAVNKDKCLAIEYLPEQPSAELSQELSSELTQEQTQEVTPELELDW
jgi:conjugative relaxase-like TrwC/TraI family protein